MPENHATANIGVVGLAVMGSNLARNLAIARGQHRRRLQPHLRAHRGADRTSTRRPASSRRSTIDDFVASLSKPRTAIIMVQAGAGTDAVIDQLAERFEPGDIIVDGGNANFHGHHPPREAHRATGIHFVGTGISGGEEGALNGPSIMPGGSAESYETLGPILASIAAVAEGEPCVTHVGTDGAGHFVKMIHNGIEYADMQLIAEAYDLLRTIGGLVAGRDRGRLRRVEQRRPGVVPDRDHRRGAPPGRRRDRQAVRRHRRSTRPDRRAPASGPCRTRSTWASRSAASREAVFARAVSSKPAQRAAVQATVQSRPDVQKAADVAAFADDVAKALYASKVVAYAQGFDAIIAGAEKYGWHINKDKIAKIWRGGCIIRAQFLNRIADAYDENPDIATLLEAPYFADAVARGRSRLAPHRRHRRALRCAGARLRRRPVVLRLARLRRASRPRSSRASATSSARTPTSASTRTARSTRCGRATVPKSRPRARRTSDPAEGHVVVASELGSDDDVPFVVSGCGARGARDADASGTRREGRPPSRTRYRRRPASTCRRPASAVRMTGGSVLGCNRGTRGSDS